GAEGGGVPVSPALPAWGREGGPRPAGGGARRGMGGVDLLATATQPPRLDAVARPSSIRAKIASPYHHATRRALGRAVHARRSRFQKVAITGSGRCRWAKRRCTRAIDRLPRDAGR